MRFFKHQLIHLSEGLVTSTGYAAIGLFKVKNDFDWNHLKNKAEFSCFGGPTTKHMRRYLVDALIAEEYLERVEVIEVNFGFHPADDLTYGRLGAEKRNPPRNFIPASTKR